MKFLVRRIVHHNGSVERSDQTVDVDTLSIGRGTDQTIQLADRNVPFAHSVLSTPPDGLYIRSVSRAPLFVNGKRRRSRKLGLDDVIQIGTFTIRVEEGERDAYLTFVVEQSVPTTDEDLLARLQDVRRPGQWMSKRMLSWGLALAVLIGALLIPLLGSLSPEAARALAISGMPDDRLWLSGPLHPSHRLVGDDCSVCHANVFTRVRDRECLQCHGDVRHHVDVKTHSGTRLEATRCAVCHHEHNEPPRLVRVDQSLCVDCHANLQIASSATSAIEPVSDFGHDHPEFKVSLLMPGATPSVQRISLNEPTLAERSNLQFSHSMHLDPAGVDGPDGAIVLRCASCHEAESGGARMRAVQMETHCSGCHKLTFDAQAPEREVPHGQPSTVLTMMDEYFARKFLMSDVEFDNAPTRGRAARRPGASPTLSAPERQLLLDWARERATQTATQIFERTICVACHQVTRGKGSDRPAWDVSRVELTAEWMPMAHFDHYRHRTMACGDCHDAADSDLSSDVLIPSISICRDCHGGENDTHQLASTCIECHGFHLPRHEPMRHVADRIVIGTTRE